MKSCCFVTVLYDSYFYFLCRYDELCHPSFKFSNPDNRQTRSFTQVVWKKSSKLGVGHAVTRKDKTICTYVVAIYKPNGNVIGRFDENVFQGSFKKENYCENPKLPELPKRSRAKRKKISLKGIYALDNKEGCRIVEMVAMMD